MQHEPDAIRLDPRMGDPIYLSRTTVEDDDGQPLVVLGFKGELDGQPVEAHAYLYELHLSGATIEGELSYSGARSLATALIGLLDEVAKHPGYMGDGGIRA